PAPTAKGIRKVERNLGVVRARLVKRRKVPERLVGRRAFLRVEGLEDASSEARIVLARLELPRIGPLAVTRLAARRLRRRVGLSAHAAIGHGQEMVDVPVVRMGRDQALEKLGGRR